MIIAPTHYPSDNTMGNYSAVAAEILEVLRSVGDHQGPWGYPRDVMDELLNLKFDGYMLYQLIDIGRQAVRAGLVES